MRDQSAKSTSFETDALFEYLMRVKPSSVSGRRFPMTQRLDVFQVGELLRRLDPVYLYKGIVPKVVKGLPESTPCLSLMGEMTTQADLENVFATVFRPTMNGLITPERILEIQNMFVAEAMKAPQNLIVHKVDGEVVSALLLVLKEDGSELILEAPFWILKSDHLLDDELAKIVLDWQLLARKVIPKDSSNVRFMARVPAYDRASQKLAEKLGLKLTLLELNSNDRGLN